MDNVNHPCHYADSCSVECIDVMQLIFGSGNLAMYCLMNAFKYLWRHERKNKEEDIKKAKWYLNKITELEMDYRWKEERKTLEMLVNKAGEKYEKEVNE